MSPENQSPYSQTQNNNGPFWRFTNRPLFAIASLIFGILSLITICTGFLPLPIGALGIIFAILAARKGRPWSSSAIVGTILSGIGMGLAVLMITISMLMLPTMLKDPQYREYLNNMSEQLYGETFDEMMQEGYGINLDDYLSGNQN